MNGLVRGTRIRREITRRHARTFYLASHFLPRVTRNHSYTLYGFCRWADDAVDCAPTREDAVRHLALVREVLDRAYGREMESPALMAFRRTVRERSIPRILFEELIRGMEMDLTIDRYPNFAALDLYCYRVAGVVGLMMTHVFGFRHARCLPHAEALGRAMQLTNILRDVREDLDRGRIYLPADELRRFGLNPEDLCLGRVDERFREFLKFQIQRAREQYAFAEEGIADLVGKSSRLTVRVMGRLYGDILRAIETQNYDVFRARSRVSGLRKMRLLADCQIRAARDEARRFWI